MNSTDKSAASPKTYWNPPPRPDWLATMNSEGACLNLRGVVPLDAGSLLDTAIRSTGLDDFGDDSWREPFAVLLKALEEEAELNLMGRLMARNDILMWLQNRLHITATFAAHPEIADQPIQEPVIIIGLSRSGTSILFEILSQDPAFGAPQTWEALAPCPPPTSAGYASDPRVEAMHRVTTQWSRVVPEYGAMHEMGARIPCECGLIMSNSFISEHIECIHQTPSYSAWLAQADWTPGYEYHRKILQLLQWKNPRRHWLLKNPNHQLYLPTLLKVYPDARLIQTHRDPLKCMASVTSVIGSIYWMRSDKPFDSGIFESLLAGAPLAQRLENIMRLRDEGVIPPAQIADSLYQDLLDDPLTAVRRIYEQLDMPLSATALARMQAYIAAKPKGKHGKHDYRGADTGAAAAERALFDNYRNRYGVPNES